MSGIKGHRFFPPPCIEIKSDGIYIVGDNISVSFESEEEAKEILLKLPTIQQLYNAINSKMPIATGIIYYFLQQRGEAKYFYDTLKKNIIVIAKETLRINYKYTEDDRYKEIEDFNFIPVSKPILNEYVDRTKVKANNGRYYYSDRENEICKLVECDNNIRSFFKRKFNEFRQEQSTEQLNLKFKESFKNNEKIEIICDSTNTYKNRRKFFDNLNKQIISIEKIDILKAFGKGNSYYYKGQGGLFLRYTIDQEQNISGVRLINNLMHWIGTPPDDAIREYEEAEKVYLNSKSYIEVYEEGRWYYNLSSPRYVELEKEKSKNGAFRK